MRDLLLLAGACIAAYFFGGWEWVLPCLAAGFARLSPGIVACGLAWLTAFRFTGDRRLFFCYTILYAVYLARSLKGPEKGFLGAGLVVALFLAIRGEVQGASMSVLTVELVCAAVILAVCVPLIKHPLLAAIAGSVLALASLAIH